MRFLMLFAMVAATTGWTEMNPFESESHVMLMFTALSADGKTLAVGERSAVREKDSQLKIYTLNDNKWEQKGQTIYTNSTTSIFHKVSLSADGNKLAFGNIFVESSALNYVVAKVFSFQGFWKELTDDTQLTITPINPDNSIVDVKLSSDGQVLALSHTNVDVNASQVRVFSLANDQINQMGRDIKGYGAGAFLALSSNGTILATATQQDNSYGHINVLSYSSQYGYWVPIGEPFRGQQGKRIGNSVSLSATGNRIAFGVEQTNPTSMTTQTRVYEFQATKTWTQLGNDIQGKASWPLQDLSVYTYAPVALSANGDILATGQDLVGTSDAGRLGVYSLQANNVWEQLGNDIQGDSNHQQLGIDLALSQDGSMLATTASRKGATNSTSILRIFKL